MNKMDKVKRDPVDCLPPNRKPTRRLSRSLVLDQQWWPQLPSQSEEEGHGSRRSDTFTSVSPAVCVYSQMVSIMRWRTCAGCPCRHACVVHASLYDMVRSLTCERSIVS
jgi:hypothetical protein